MRRHSSSSVPGDRLSLQEEYWPTKVCYGCGPSNAAGLHVKSRLVVDYVAAAMAASAVAFEECNDAGIAAGVPMLVTECTFVPQAHHTALPGVLNGGVISSVMDCHSNITAAVALHRALQLRNGLAMTVTLDLHVRFKAPTPMQPILVVAWLNATDLHVAKQKARVHAVMVASLDAVRAFEAWKARMAAVPAGQWPVEGLPPLLRSAATSSFGGHFQALRDKK